MIRLWLLKILLFLGIESVYCVQMSGKIHNSVQNSEFHSSHFNATQDYLQIPRGECEPPPAYIPPQDDIAKSSLWDILKKTENQLTVHTGDGIILLGNTGGGKTTVALFVTGNISKLHVYETEGEDFIIVDAEQKIGISTASRTLVPEVFPDPPNSLFYVDFPGFSDNRGTNADITANFLMKKMTDALSSVRLAFIVMESSVAIGQDKRDFDYCVSSAIQMVRNLDKLQQGIGMIVTKVKNFNNQQKNRTDEVILKGITGFLTKYKEEEEAKLNLVRRKGQEPLTRADRETIELKIKFVGILLQPNKIWFQRQPGTCGPFSETPWAEDNKKRMIQLVRDDLKSVPSTKDDFGYALSAETIIHVHSLYEELNSYVTSNTTALVDNLRTAHFQGTLTVREFFAQAKWIADDLSNFTLVIENFQSNSKSPAHLSNLMSSTMNLRGYNQAWGNQMKTEMHRIESYMDFFDQVNREGSTFPRDDTNWILPLKNWVHELSQRNEWFTFLTSLRIVLSTYNFHRNAKPSSRPRDLLELQEILGESSHIVTSSIISIYDKMESIVPQDIDILWKIVDEALRPPEILCYYSSNQMTVRGAFIKTSDFTESSGSYKGCPFTPLITVVFATRSLFVDTNIRPLKSDGAISELAILSPVWEVVVVGSTHYQVDLQGKNGPGPSRSHMSSHKNNSLRATITSIPETVAYKCKIGGLVKDGEAGRDGSPGNPGHPGGHFIGIGGQVKSGDHVDIIVSGGVGGAGQAGASGGNGQKGRFFSHDDWGNCPDTGPCWECTSPGTCGSGQWTRHFDKCHKDGDGYIFCYTAGCLGGRGGTGGDGGVGGKGGSKGKIAIFFAGEGDSSGGFHNTVAVGTKGIDGNGGSGGIGGLRGNGTVARAKFWIQCGCWWTDYKPHYTSDRSPNGPVGNAGGNSNGIKDPSKPNFTLSLLQTAIHYKKFALTEESEIFPNEFIYQLETHPEIIKGHVPIYFAQEILHLEELNLQLKNANVDEETLTLRLIPHYESLLGRLDNFTRSKEEGGNPLQDADRKFISLIYTMVLNQLRSMRMVFGTPVIVNVEGYLESVGLRLEQYEKTGTKVMVAEERGRYKDAFYEKIEQAMVFLCDTVDPALDETHGEIAQVTEQLMEAVKEMIAAAEAAEKEYKEALDQMKKTAALRSVLNIFKVGGAVLGALGSSVGGTVASIIGSVASVTEGIALDSGGNLKPPSPLPSSIKKYAEEMEKRNKATSQERQDELNTLLQEARIAVKENVEALNDLDTKIVHLEEKKNVLLQEGPKGSMKQFQDLDKHVRESEGELRTALTTKVESIKKALAGEGTAEEQEIANKFGQKAIEAIGHVESTVKIVATLGVAAYNAHKADKKEIARLALMADEASKQVQDLKKYEQAINELLLPFTHSIIEELDAVAAQVANQSPVFLRVTEWKVQKKLRDFDYFMQDFSQSFPDIARQYAKHIENLKEAMTLMIDLYDFIQQYNEQMQFADFIANVNSPRANDVSLGQTENTLYDRINLAMQASLILTEWHRVVQTFQQWVYPFSEAFKSDLETSKIPDNMKPETTSADGIYSFIVPDISRRVKNLIASLKAYKSAAFEAVDGVLIHSEFNSDQISTVPFHVWKVENEERRIKQLLSGKPTTLSVTPEFTYRKRMSAVKFTIAEIEPKARNVTLQAELKEKLNYLRVSLTHSGVSRYLHNEEMEEMVGNNLTIQYNFERDSNGERNGKNNVYKKLENGDMLLSPYTLWTVQLRKAQDDLPFDFEEFAKFSSLVDLELIGKGSFVRQKGTRKAFGPIPLKYFNRQIAAHRIFKNNV